MGQQWFCFSMNGVPEECFDLQCHALWRNGMKAPTFGLSQVGYFGLLSCNPQGLPSGRLETLGSVAK